MLGSVASLCCCMWAISLARHSISLAPAYPRALLWWLFCLSLLNQSFLSWIILISIQICDYPPWTHCPSIAAILLWSLWKQGSKNSLLAFFIFSISNSLFNPFQLVSTETPLKMNITVSFHLVRSVIYFLSSSYLKYVSFIEYTEPHSPGFFFLTALPAFPQSPHWLFILVPVSKCAMAVQFLLSSFSRPSSRWAHSVVFMHC